ncbi:hypothetical protein [Thauera sp. AutoDN2]|uniref:hypothetical protein n=1 Tax=Thauera sp. AutoDN2 TaxID=3416051 RepID=UPI003F4C1C66
MIQGSLRRHLLVAALALGLLQGLCAPAARGTDIDWRLSGFATLGAVQTRSDTLQFARVGIDAPGGQRTDLGPDSVLGVQADVRLSERNAFVLQLVTRETQRGDYDPRPALAFLSHALSPELTLRAGRFRSPFFMLSDTSDINYNQVWVRPPVEVYGLNPFSDIDGIDLLYRAHIGDMFVELHPYFGRSRIPVINGGQARLSKLGGMTLTLESGSLSLSAGYAKADLAVERTSPGFVDFASTLPQALRAELSGSGASASFSSLGMQWDDGVWRFSAEVARNTASKFSNSATAAYASAGRRFGSVMPYLSVARQWQDQPLVEAAEWPGYEDRIKGFNRSRNQAQKSFSVGMRWDFAPSAALKAEFTQARTSRNALGTFIARDDPFAPGLDRRTINLLSVSVDVVF